MTLSNLPKTWLIDIDGTLLFHNGHKTQGGDRLLGGVRKFFATIAPSDKIILLTARNKSEIPALEAFLARENLHYDEIIADLPAGERILINDTKPSGLKTAYAISKARNTPLEITFRIDENL